MKKHVEFQQHVLNSLAEIEGELAALGKRIVGTQAVAKSCQVKVTKLRMEVAAHLVDISFEREKK